MPHKILYIEFDPNGGESEIKHVEPFNSYSRAKSTVKAFNRQGQGQRAGSTDGSYIKAFMKGENLRAEIRAEENACVQAAVAASQINKLQEIDELLEERREAKRQSRTPTGRGRRAQRDGASDSKRGRSQKGTGDHGPVHRRDRPAKRVSNAGQHTPSSIDDMKKMLKTLTKKTYGTADECRILVCGSRDWPHTAIGIIREHLTQAIKDSGKDPKHILVITGSITEEDNGVDSMVDQLCRTELGIACAIYRAPWEWARRHVGNPRPAGPIRNGWMLRWGRPHLVLAFHPYLINSRGTKNMVDQARREGIAVRIIDSIK